MTVDRIGELTKGMLRKRLYVVLSHGKPGADLAAVLPAHLEYMIDLEKRGILFASGPFDGGAKGDGLTILRVASAEDARAIAMRDPFVSGGLRTFEIREWTLMEGSFGLTVKFSNQSVEVA